MDAVLWDYDKVVPDVKADHGMVNTVVGADPCDHDRVTAGEEIQPAEDLFQGGLIKAVVGKLSISSLFAQRPIPSSQSSEGNTSF